MNTSVVSSFVEGIGVRAVKLNKHLCSRCRQEVLKILATPTDALSIVNQIPLYGIYGIQYTPMNKTEDRSKPSVVRNLASVPPLNIMMYLKY